MAIARFHANDAHLLANPSDRSLRSIRQNYRVAFQEICRSEIGERCDYDLVNIRADVEDEAEALRDLDARRARAWAEVSVAMRAYFVWRAAARPGAAPGTQ